MHTDSIQMIGAERDFYGYIVGLQLERGDLPESPDIPARMFARFEYGARTTVWEIPDHKLFRALSKHLCDNAQMRDEHEDYGYSKLYIEKKDGEWEVDLP